jgi:hypothetical protein
MEARIMVVATHPLRVRHKLHVIKDLPPNVVIRARVRHRTHLLEATPLPNDPNPRDFGDASRKRFQRFLQRKL